MCCNHIGWLLPIAQAKIRTTQAVATNLVATGTHCARIDSSRITLIQVNGKRNHISSPTVGQANALRRV